MLVLLLGVLVGMALGVGIMLVVSWVTCLRKENITVKEHVKDLCQILSTAPEYHDQ